MIIIYKKSAFYNMVDPIVILDYTRSDDSWSESQIQLYTQRLSTLVEGKQISRNMKIYSLDYSFTFAHNGNGYGNALKTFFQAEIINAPIELIDALNIKQFVSQENLAALSSANNYVIDPQSFLPVGGFVMRLNSNTNETVIRPFMLYGTPFNFDSRRINSHLTLKGASFDSKVIRLKFAFNIDKTFPLVSQLSTILAKEGFALNADASLSADMPVVSRYYPPAPLASMLDDICTDNNLFFDIKEESKTIILKSLKPVDKPFPSGYFLSFNNYVPGSKLISTFSLQDYASCEFECEAFDVDLFKSVTIYDDSFSPGLFENLRRSIKVFSTARKLLQGYDFYIMAYELHSSKYKTSAVIRGSNNWLISNYKLDNFLENKIYAGQL